MLTVAQVGLLLLGWLSLSTSLASCLHRLQFPDNGRPAVTSSQDFERLIGASPGARGNGVRLAGRVVRAEPGRTGWRILADWLPFPERVHEGPGGPARGRAYRFYVRFHGSIDDEGRAAGNEFVLTGRVSGREQHTTREGLRRQLPVVVADCLHVWKTAGTDLVDFLAMDPLDDRYPPPLEETYCVP